MPPLNGYPTRRSGLPGPSGSKITRLLSLLRRAASMLRRASKCEEDVGINVISERDKGVREGGAG